jgi:hypothetical protein
MIDAKNISMFNKLLYAVLAIAMLVIALDITIWRP